MLTQENQHQFTLNFTEDEIYQIERLFFNLSEFNTFNSLGYSNEVMYVLLDGMDSNNSERVKDAIQLLNTIAYSAQAIQVAHLNMRSQIAAFENEMNLEESLKK